MLRNRMRLLKDSNVISESNFEYMNEVIDYLEKGNYENNKLEMLVTHLAMGIQRVIDNDELDGPDDFIWEEIQNAPSYEHAMQMLDVLLSNAPCELPDNERKFLLLHLCNLLDG